MSKYKKTVWNLSKFEFSRKKGLSARAVSNFPKMCQTPYKLQV